MVKTSFKQKSQPTTLTSKKGQILVLQVFGIFLVLALFLSSLKIANGLSSRQHSQLAADLVALSAAQVEAEILQFIGVVNQVMLREAQIMIGLVATPIILAASIVGLPLVPAAVKAAARGVPALIKSLRSLGHFEKMLVRSYPGLVALEVWKTAQANGFAGGVPVPLPKLPVQPRFDKFRDDLLSSFGLKNSSVFRDLIEGKNKKVKVAKNKNPKINAKVNKSLSVLEHLKQRISLRKFASPFYLDERWPEHQINVVVWNEQKQIRVASARSFNNNLPSDKKIIDDTNNNYILAKDTKPIEGFQAKLVAVPDLLEKFPLLSKNLDRLEKQLKRLPVDIPIRKEHLKWIQH